MYLYSIICIFIHNIVLFSDPGSKLAVLIDIIRKVSTR